MDFLNNITSSNNSNNEDKKDPTKHKPTSSELLSSAKTVAEAAKSTLSKDETQNVDKAKVAGAADNLLHAASDYGKLEEKGYGQYVEKAQNYLHQYSAPSSDHPATTAAAAAPAPAEKAKEEESGGGLGGYMKMAQGFMK